MAEAETPKEDGAPTTNGSLAKEKTPPPRTPYKSYRKKYRKMRVRFEDQMNEANVLFKREYYTWDVAKRLQEENDQILDMITDLLLERSHSTNKHQSDQIRLAERLQLSRLERELFLTTSDLVRDDSVPSDLIDLDWEMLEFEDPDRHIPPAFFTTTHEEKYLTDLDASLSAMPSTNNLPSNIETVNPEPPPRPRPARLTEKDFRQRNPISVGNWLQKNQPHIFEEQKEKDKEKEKDTNEKVPESATRSKAAAKREKEKILSKQDQPFEGLDDEIGFDPNFEPPSLGSSRGKRKRGDDDTYRPKGGGSRSAAAKRKREKEESEPKPKAGKKARTSTAATGADDAGNGT